MRASATTTTPSTPDECGRRGGAGLDAVEAQAVGSLLTLLSDPLRARILAALLEVEELCVGDLALALGTSEDSVSYALRILRTAGLVRRRREGRMGYYRLRDGPSRPVLADTLATARQLAALHPETSADSEDAE